MKRRRFARARARAAVDSEQQLIQRREKRLRNLPAPPAPPAVDGPTVNPIDQFIVAGWSKASGGPARSCATMRRSCAASIST